jgi:hypothetical protein
MNAALRRGSHRQAERGQMRKKLNSNKTTRSTPRSLIEHVEETVRSTLGVTSTRHRSAMRDLRLTIDQDLVGLIFRTVADNHKRGDAAARRDRSQENWRWQRLQPQIAPHNKSPEIMLERAIAAACGRTGRTDWANQVPVASGLIADAADGR